MESLFSSDTVIIGVGNTILSDDGLGVHAARLLKLDSRVPPGIMVVDGGTMGPELAAYASHATRVLLLDAMNSGSAPGALARMTGRDLLAAKSGSSVHQLGLVDLIAALFLMSTHSQDIVVLGVQPANSDWGTVLSSQVEASLGHLVDAAVAQLQLWNEPLHTNSENGSASCPPMQPQNRRAGESSEKGAA